MRQLPQLGIVAWIMTPMACFFEEYFKFLSGTGLSDVAIGSFKENNSCSILPRRPPVSAEKR